MAKPSLSVARAMSALGRALARIERQATLEGDVRARAETLLAHASGMRVRC